MSRPLTPGSEPPVASNGSTRQHSYHHDDIHTDSDSEPAIEPVSEPVTRSLSEPPPSLPDIYDNENCLNDIVLPSVEPDDRDVDTPGASASISHKRKAEMITNGNVPKRKKKVHRKITFEEWIVEEVARRRAQYATPEPVNETDDSSTEPPSTSSDGSPRA
ncbi:hypothetical protein F503_01300 [Ophiostoma piceae UAMH 11346]|uniref:Uncharacterized protein n=1 Tax=Ophiostoma piceae (strain UAMH 11346) TaxID=1262450 RepID=S3BXX6_OPHP1|nr:hypothetical protein F503_01300 [Ophiostoma piceae UAMH 11346]